MNRKSVVRIVRIFVLTLLLLLLPALALAQDDPSVHVVQPRDTLANIAHRYGTTWRHLAELNGIADPTRIYVGQRLVIRQGSPPSPQVNAVPQSSTVYVVRRGDTLAKIANRHGVSVNALVRWNGISDPTRIYVGQRLRLDPTRGAPSAASAPAAPIGSGKVILISLSQQHLYAYQDGQLVFSTPVTTGRPGLGTPTGRFEVLRKYSPYRFVSPWPPGHRYYYEPAWSDHSLRFTWRGHHIHDSPWRTEYGPGTNTSHQASGEWRTGSHGCVNVPPAQMPTLYRWASVGTPIVIRG